MGLGGIAQPKPAKGSHTKAHRRRQATVKAEEQDLKLQSKLLDGLKCRYPGCKSREYELHSAHWPSHKGMGGDPKGLRTKLETLISLCAVHHSMLDLKWIRIVPWSAHLGTRGRCSFWEAPKRKANFWWFIGISDPSRLPAEGGSHG